MVACMHALMSTPQPGNLGSGGAAWGELRNRMTVRHSRGIADTAGDDGLRDSSVMR